MGHVKRQTELNQAVPIQKNDKYKTYVFNVSLIYKCMGTKLGIFISILATQTPDLNPHELDGMV